MLERLRYVLILLLFVLAGNLGDTSFQDAGGVQPALDETVTACPPAAVRNYFSVALCSCSASIEAPVVQTDQKAVVRQRAAVEAEMTRMQRTLDMIRYKCWYYETAMKEGGEERLKALSPSEMPQDVRRANEGAHRP